MVSVAPEAPGRPFDPEAAVFAGSLPSGRSADILCARCPAGAEKFAVFYKKQSIYILIFITSSRKIERIIFPVALCRRAMYNNQKNKDPNFYRMATVKAAEAS